MKYFQICCLLVCIKMVVSQDTPIVYPAGLNIMIDEREDKVQYKGKCETDSDCVQTVALEKYGVSKEADKEYVSFLFGKQRKYYRKTGLICDDTKTCNCATRQKWSKLKKYCQFPRGQLCDEDRFRCSIGAVCAHHYNIDDSSNPFTYRCKCLNEAICKAHFNAGFKIHPTIAIVLSAIILLISYEIL